jgi:hypothetical protein
MPIEIKLLNNNELPFANDLFNRIYKSNRSYEKFKWEFLDGPSGESIYIAAIDTEIKAENKIVGIQCAIPLMMVDFNNNEILTAKSEDTLVDPNYRGLDIFNKMYALLFEECQKKGVNYIWGFTPAYKPFIKLGFKLDFKSSQLIYVIKPFKAYEYLTSLNPNNRFIDKLKIFGLSFLSKVYSFKTLTKIKNNFIVEFKNFELKILSFNNNEHYKSSINLRLDIDYIKWRIIDNAHNNNYKNIVISDQNKNIVADIIINTREKVGYIEQIIFSSTLDLTSKTEIIKLVVHELIALEIALIRFLCFESNPINAIETKILLSLGFYKISRGNWFVWKSLQDTSKFEAKDVVLTRLFTQGIM